MPRQKVMVLGATGFIGPAVLRRLSDRGHEAVAVSRTGGNRRRPGLEWRSLDRNNPDALSAAVDATRPDAVIDLLAYTARETRPLLARLAGRVGRYVMASSGDVYRQYDLLHRRDTAAPQSELAEDAPLRTRLYPYRGAENRPASDPQAWMDQYDKIPIEQAVRETEGLAWSILRLPMIYGPGDRQRRFAWAIGPMLAGHASVTIDAQWAEWRTSLGYVDDVAEALVLAAVHPASEGQTFNVGPARTRSNYEWARALAEACAWEGTLETNRRSKTPEPTRSRLEALDLSVPICLRTDLIRTTLGYVEVTPVEHALTTTIEAERRRG